MNTTKIDSLVNIMEFCDIQTIFQMKFINRRNFKFSILRTENLRLVISILQDDSNLIEFFNFIFLFFYKNKIQEINEIKIIFSYMLVKKLNIIKSLKAKGKKYSSLVISNFYNNELGAYFKLN